MTIEVKFKGFEYKFEGSIDEYKSMDEHMLAMGKQIGNEIGEMLQPCVSALMRKYAFPDQPQDKKES